MSYAISVRGLSKEYRIVHQDKHVTRITEAMANWAKNPFRKQSAETFLALDDISFDVEPGEVLGIIGRNGAGKSTLLKILSRITDPTKGEVRMRGRAASLLEVGTGFSQELTGRENIYLNGAILGMRRREIDRQFDAIVDFAEIERFLDTPVKRYSSGMFVRLAFAVAAHLNPEILIVDEVLAVGDAEFQRKCLGKMQDVSQEGGRTVLFVSHNMASVKTLCNSALLLHKGRVAEFGPVDGLTDAYLNGIVQGNDGRIDMRGHPGRSARFAPWIQCLEMLNERRRPSDHFGSADLMEVVIGIKPDRFVRNPRLAVTIADQMGRRIATYASYFEISDSGHWEGEFVARCIIPRLNLGPGSYILGASIADFATGLIDSVDEAIRFDVQWDGSHPTGEVHLPVYGPVIVRAGWQFDKVRQDPDNLHCAEESRP